MFSSKRNAAVERLAKECAAIRAKRLELVADGNGEFNMIGKAQYAFQPRANRPAMPGLPTDMLIGEILELDCREANPVVRRCAA